MLSESIKQLFCYIYKFDDYIMWVNFQKFFLDSPTACTTCTITDF